MSQAEPIVGRWIIQANSVIGARMPTVLVEDFDGPANAETTFAAGAIRIKWRRGYPAQLYLPSPDAADMAQAAVEAEYTACHELGHGVAYWLRSLGVDVPAALYRFRGYAGDPAVIEATLPNDEAHWASQPREQVAETLRAAIGGRWIRPERAFNEGKPVDPLAARAWMLSLIARAFPAPPVNLAIHWLPPLNYTQGRSRPIKYIVLHTTEGADSRGWLTNPVSKVSAHYLVRGAPVYQLVDEEDTAWHAGRIVGTPTTPLYTPGVNPNDESIGIEMEGFAAQLLDADTINTTAALIQDIRGRHGRLPLVSHSELSPGDRSDPGAQNRAAVEERLGDNEMTDAEFKAMYDRLIKPDMDNTINAMKERLSIDAHHTHDATTSEPK